MDGDKLARVHAPDRRLRYSSAVLHRRSLHEFVQYRLRPRYRKDAERIYGLQRTHRPSRTERQLGRRVLGPKPFQQALHPGRVRCAATGQRHDPRCGGGVLSGLNPALRRVPRRAEDLRSDAANEDWFPSCAAASLRAASTSATSAGDRAAGSAAATSAASAASCACTRARLI